MTTLAAGLAVDVSRLGRRYPRRGKSPEVVALAEIDLRVTRGEVHGLLGPNGAGKTTLVRILSTLVTPTSGSALVLGHDVVRAAARVREAVGVVFGGERGLYLRATARRNLLFWAAMNKVDRATARRRTDELLDRLGLADRADEPVERFSRGMKQRLHVARGLIHEPAVLFLDEPTAGMDIVAAHEFREVVAELKRDGRTVLLTTHDMAEAEQLCDQVSVIDQGRLLLTGRTDEVGRRLRTSDSVEFTFDRADRLWLERLRSHPAVREVEARLPGSRWCVHPVDVEALSTVLAWLVAEGVTDLRSTKPTLAEVYLHTVQQRGVLL